MPRDLSDVLHYFMPELERPDGRRAPPAREPSVHPPAPRPEPNDLLPLTSVPIGDRDLLRGELVTSLAAEIGEMGGRTILVTPDTSNARSLFANAIAPIQGVGAAELDIVEAGSLHELAAAAIDRAMTLKRDAVDGVVIARIPPSWLITGELPSELFDWLLLFTSPHERNLSHTYAVASRVLGEHPDAEIGVAVHGAAGRHQGEAAFGLLARTVEQRLGRSLVNYGLLLEDLDIYRSLAARQAIGLAHPESPARAALREAAKLVFERARKTAFH